MLCIRPSDSNGKVIPYYKCVWIDGHVILHVQKVIPKRVLLLEERNGQTWKDHMCNCAPCHFPTWMAKLTHP
jgi:hypothetical protein